MRQKGYIKEAILQCLNSKDGKGLHSADLVDPVSELLGRRITKMRIAAYMKILATEDKILRVKEGKYDLRRWRYWRR